MFSRGQTRYCTVCRFACALYVFVLLFVFCEVCLVITLYMVSVRKFLIPALSTESLGSPLVSTLFVIASRLGHAVQLYCSSAFMR